MEATVAAAGSSCLTHDPTWTVGQLPFEQRRLVVVATQGFVEDLAMLAAVAEPVHRIKQDNILAFLLPLVAAGEESGPKSIVVLLATLGVDAPRFLIPQQPAF